LLEAKAMSSNKVLAEKLRSARAIVGFLHKKTTENSMDEDMLDAVWNILDDAVGQLLLPVPEAIVLGKPVELKEITIKLPEDPNVCPCDDCMKSKTRKRTWTAEQKAQHSAHLKGLWAAKKAAKAATIPL